MKKESGHSKNNNRLFPYFFLKKNAKTDKIKNDIEILAPTLYNSSGSFGNSFTE